MTHHTYLLFKDMGTILTSHNEDQDEVSEFCSPNDSNWVLTHAQLTHLPITVVEHLWEDYNKLELSQRNRDWDEAPKLNPETKDALDYLAGKGYRDVMSFLQFCSAYRWKAMPDREIKARAVFKNMFPNGAVTQDNLYAALRRRCPKETEESLKRFSKVFFMQMNQLQDGKWLCLGGRLCCMGDDGHTKGPGFGT
ncbi:uncharacterized protein LOC135392649 isoform X2 [Ornithodoros turicata]|uniref:uncharacterized protein LOC135392649 isoform X2 n=1 Tax=Ornithodoros turicata TaxID=34597 RepID=UPI0031394BF6